MYKDVLRSIEGIDILPVVGLIIFFSFFSAWAWFALRSNKEYIKHMEEMPLDLEPASDNIQS